MLQTKVVEKIIIIIIIIIITIMFMKRKACFLFLDPQDEVGPSISSSVVLCSFVLLVDVVVLVLVFYLCPSTVRVVATFPGTVLFPFVEKIKTHVLCSSTFFPKIVPFMR